MSQTFFIFLARVNEKLASLWSPGVSKSLFRVDTLYFIGERLERKPLTYRLKVAALSTGRASRALCRFRSIQIRRYQLAQPPRSCRASSVDQGCEIRAKHSLPPTVASDPVGGDSVLAARSGDPPRSVHGRLRPAPAAPTRARPRKCRGRGAWQ